ncbi:MAG: glycerate kinase [Anaerococcus sp.]|nr:glycerate kinase [Anaerococcus sp.]
MNILIAIDTIKNFEDSVKIGEIFKNRLDLKSYPIPFLDGGEGTIESMKFISGGKLHYVNVHNPLGEAITAKYLLKDDFATIEMAESSGLSLIYKDDLDIMKASSLGLGEVFVDALDHGAKSFYIGVGDSAVNDMGMGMLYALGVRFYDENANDLSPSAQNLVKIDKIDTRFKRAKIKLATSSELSIFGKNSFLETRAYRKGASDLDVARLYRGSENFIKKTSKLLGSDQIDFPSLGSGGGVAWALYNYFNTRISRPMDYILKEIGFPKLIEDMDFMILGEDLGQFDGISSINIAKLAKRYNEDIKLVFLHDKNDKKNIDLSLFDYIYEYDIEDDLDRFSLIEKIDQLAKEVNEADFFESLKIKS